MLQASDLTQAVLNLIPIPATFQDHADTLKQAFDKPTILLNAACCSLHNARNHQHWMMSTTHQKAIA